MSQRPASLAIKPGARSAISASTMFADRGGEEGAEERAAALNGFIEAAAPGSELMNGCGGP